MSLGRLIGNARVRGALLRAHARDRLPHALLFAGPEGVGKRTAALELARAVTCVAPVGGDACDTCPSCARAARGEHPDIRVWAPEGTFIKIAQMRELAREAYFRPFEARRRAMIVEDAHLLREVAANAILKILDESPVISLCIL